MTVLLLFICCLLVLQLAVGFVCVCVCVCVCVFLKYLLYLNCVLAVFVLFAFRTVLWVGLRSVIVAIPWSLKLAFWIVEPEKFFNHKTGEKVFIMAN